MADVRLLQEFPVGPIFNVIGLAVSPVGETEKHLIPSDTMLTYSAWYNGWDAESVLKQELDTDLDLASFEFVYSSEPVELRFEDGTLSFYKKENVVFSFLDIEKLLFQIRPKPDLPEGTRLDSKVIMIDSNGPEKVDSCFNIIKSILRPWVVSDEDLLIGPNPTGDFFRVQSSTIYEDVSDAQLLVYDYLGRVVRTYDFVSNKRYYLDGLVAGAYVVVLQSASEPSMHQVGKLFVQ